MQKSKNIQEELEDAIEQLKHQRASALAELDVCIEEASRLSSALQKQEITTNEAKNKFRLLQRKPALKKNQQSSHSNTGSSIRNQKQTSMQPSPTLHRHQSKTSVQQKNGGQRIILQGQLARLLQIIDHLIVRELTEQLPLNITVQALILLLIDERASLVAFTKDAPEIENILEMLGEHVQSVETLAQDLQSSVGQCLRLHAYAHDLITRFKVLAQKQDGDVIKLKQEFETSIKSIDLQIVHIEKELLLETPHTQPQELLAEKSIPPICTLIIKVYTALFKFGLNTDNHLLYQMLYKLFLEDKK